MNSGTEMHVSTPYQAAHSPTPHLQHRIIQRPRTLSNIQTSRLITRSSQSLIKLRCNVDSSNVQDLPPRRHRVRHPSHLQRTGDMESLLLEQDVLVDGHFAAGEEDQLAEIYVHTHQEADVQGVRLPILEVDDAVERLGLVG